MKKILVLSFMFIGMQIGIGFGAEALAVPPPLQPAVPLTDSIQLVPSAYDSTRMDTVVFSQLKNEDEAQEDAASQDDSFRMDNTFETDTHPEFFLGALVVLTCLGLLFFIPAMILWFRYKNRQARYKLAAESLAAGHPIPVELLSSPEQDHQRILSKGIKNICLGIGLGVFFWLSIEEKGVAAIGFLIFCMGVGQILIAYTTRPRPSAPSPTDTPEASNGQFHESEAKNRQSATRCDPKPSDPNTPHA